MNTLLGHIRASTVLTWPIFVYLAHSLLVSNVADHAWHCLLACLLKNEGGFVKTSEALEPSSRALKVVQIAFRFKSDWTE